MFDVFGETSSSSLLKKMYDAGIFEDTINTKEKGFDFTVVFRRYLIDFLKIHGSDCKDERDFLALALSNYGIKGTNLNNFVSCILARNKILTQQTQQNNRSVSKN